MLNPHVIRCSSSLYSQRLVPIAPKWPLFKIASGKRRSIFVENPGARILRRMIANRFGWPSRKRRSILVEHWGARILRRVVTSRFGWPKGGQPKDDQHDDRTPRE